MQFHNFHSGRLPLNHEVRVQRVAFFKASPAHSRSRVRAAETRTSPWLAPPRPAEAVRC